MYIIVRQRYAYLDNYTKETLKKNLKCLKSVATPKKTNSMAEKIYALVRKIFFSGEGVKFFC